MQVCQTLLHVQHGQRLASTCCSSWQLHVLTADAAVVCSWCLQSRSGRRRTRRSLLLCACAPVLVTQACFCLQPD